MASLFDGCCCSFTSPYTSLTRHHWPLSPWPYPGRGGKRRDRTAEGGRRLPLTRSRSALSLPVKKAIELKSRGVKMLPSKESSPKNSVRKSLLSVWSVGRSVGQSVGLSAEGAGVLPGLFLEKSVYEVPSLLISVYFSTFPTSGVFSGERMCVTSPSGAGGGRSC